jgi:hypothetical protein
VASKLPRLLAVGCSLAAFAASTPARADASGWMFLGGGAFTWKQGDAASLAAVAATKDTSHFGANGLLTIDVGAGTSPEGRFIFGGIFRLQPVLANGADLALLARVCSHGFQAGDWGVALDAGAYVRTWSPLKGGGFMGDLTLGAPLGFTLTLQYQVGTEKAVGFGAVAGIDLMRLSVYRRTLLNWWQNISPDWKARQSAASGAAPHL